jgi:hypothetical protein
MNWVGAYNDVKYMHEKYGTAIDACVHPTLFNEAQVSLQKGKLFGFINNDVAIVNNTSLDLMNRYKAWEHINQFLSTESIVNTRNPLISADDLLAATAFTKASFTAMGQALGKPIIESIITEVQSELVQIPGAIPKERANILYGKVSMAQDIAARTELDNIRVSNLRTQLQDRPVMRDSASDMPKPN